MLSSKSRTRLSDWTELNGCEIIGTQDFRAGGLMCSLWLEAFIISVLSTCLMLSLFCFSFFLTWHVFQFMGRFPFGHHFRACVWHRQGRRGTPGWHPPAAAPGKEQRQVGREGQPWLPAQDPGTLLPTWAKLVSSWAGWFATDGVLHITGNPKEQWCMQMAHFLYFSVAAAGPGSADWADNLNN